MIVLIDYDNLPRIEQKRGLLHVVTRILETIGSQRLSLAPRVRLKLYGGWLESNQLSPYAKRLIGQSGVFPRALSITDKAGTARVIVRVDMGYSLEIEPSFNLEDTFRRRGMPKGLSCTALPLTNCSNVSGCPVAGFHSLISNEVCSELTCTVPLADIITRHEQKLVDTMIVADLIHLATSRTPEIVLVSSDDDLWTGIKSALLIGSRILHIHTIPGRKTPSRYSIGAGNNYNELNLLP